MNGEAKYPDTVKRYFKTKDTSKTVIHYTLNYFLIQPMTAECHIFPATVKSGRRFWGVFGGSELLQELRVKSGAPGTE